MENDELKDILLERDDDARGLKLKKLLIFIAALIILFLIIVVAMKLVNSSDPSQAQNEADSRLVLPPVPAEQPVDKQAPIADTNSDNKKGDTQLFEQVPIVPENKQQDDFEDMIKKVDTPVKKVEKVAATDKKSEAKSAKTENKVDKKIEKKVETKIEKTDKKAEVAKTEPATKGSYVQVFVTSKFNPNAEYMKKIAAKGYSYNTIKVGELTKILVGPFDEKTLQKAVGDIRKDINKDAFIFRAK